MSGRRTHPRAWPVPGLALAALLVCAVPLHAQQDLVEDTAAPLEDAPGVEAPDEPRTWDLRLGALAGVAPDYTGAEDYDLRAIPYLRVNWKDRLILRGRSLEWNLYRNGELKMGPTGRLRGGRDEDDNRKLDGLGDIDGTVELGGFVRYKRGPWRIRVTALQDVNGEHSGARVQVNAGVQIPFDRPWFLLRANVNWSSGDFMSTYYSVDAVQSRRSGLPQFDADGGLKDAGFSIASRLPISQHWSVLAILGYDRLLGDAADSPIVKDRGDADQFFGSLGVAYDF